uniref:Tudor domain-containing protein 1 n=1 Tax=Aceria tosichella TaxID=561515 RepID=A0A6G1SKQ8_9ACAR
MIKLKEVEVRPTELVYITAVNYQERTFFAQQCKHTNKDLVDHNNSIHEYCKKLYESRQKDEPAIQPAVGQVLCARYKLDSNWYRVMVKSIDNDTQECTCYFIDYGNVETVHYDNLIRLNPAEVPAMTRAPFGFFATMEDSEKLDEARSKHLLDCLMNEYVLIREHGRLKENLWRVELPKVAYNTTFWVASERKFT